MIAKPCTILAIACAIGFQGTTAHSGRSANTAEVEAKLKRIVLPELKLEKASISQVVDLLRAKSRAFDAAEKDPDRKGIRIGYARPSSRALQRLVTLEAGKITLGEALDKVSEMLGCAVVIHEEGVILGGIAPVPPDTELLTRIYRVTPDWLSHRFAEGEGANDDPFAADDRENGPRLKVKSDKDIFQRHGVSYPDGSYALFDPHSSTVIVRNTLANIELIEALLSALGTGFASFVRVDAHVYGFPHDIASEIKTMPTTSAMIHETTRRVGEGKGELLAAPSVATRSSQRARIDAGWRYDYVRGYEDKDGKDSAQKDDAFVGTAFEVDPVVGSDGFTIELNLLLSFSEGAPKMHKRKILTPVNGTEVEVESVELDSAKLTTAIALADGQRQFAGMTAHPTRPGWACLVFVTATIKTAHQAMPIPE